MKLPSLSASLAVVSLAVSHVAQDAAAQGTPRVVVIGSGFGGLACAIRMLCKGYRVTVLER